MNVENLMGQSEGTQIRDMFKSIGIELGEFPAPGYEPPGVYRGQQVVDAFKAYDAKYPGCVDMRIITSHMTGTQIRDAFRCILKKGGAPVVAPTTATTGGGGSGSSSIITGSQIVSDNRKQLVIFGINDLVQSGNNLKDLISITVNGGTPFHATAAYNVGGDLILTLPTLIKVTDVVTWVYKSVAGQTIIDDVTKVELDNSVYTASWQAS